ncbi:hypothetical protein KL930_004722, partial [Ogataea haglerorum]
PVVAHHDARHRAQQHRVRRHHVDEHARRRQQLPRLDQNRDAQPQVRAAPQRQELGEQPREVHARGERVVHRVDRQLPGQQPEPAEERARPALGVVVVVQPPRSQQRRVPDPAVRVRVQLRRRRRR